MSSPDKVGKVKTTENLDINILVYKKGVFGSADSRLLVEQLREAANKIEAASKVGFKIGDLIQLTIKMTRESEVNLE